MKRISIFLMTAILIAAGALVHGATTHRWSLLAPPPSRAEAIHAGVLRLGEASQEDVPSELPVKERSRVTCRRYNFAADPGTLVVSITSGPSGAVSTHTPDVCYPGSGYKTVQSPKKETVDLPGGAKAGIMVAVYEKKTATTVDRQRIRWAWSAAGEWEVPDNARLHYLRTGELYKLYIVTPEPAREDGRIDSETPATRTAVADVLQQYAGMLRAQ